MLTAIHPSVKLFLLCSVGTLLLGLLTALVLDLGLVVLCESQS